MPIVERVERALPCLSQRSSSYLRGRIPAVCRVNILVLAGCGGVGASGSGDKDIVLSGPLPISYTEEDPVLALGDRVHNPEAGVLPFSAGVGVANRV
jgi:hypothetical protein